MLEFLLSIFNTFFVIPITNLLLVVYHLLISVHIPYALGFSIIVLTIIIRLILSPFTKKQLETTRKLQELSPKLQALKEKHKDNPQKLQSETMALYREHGVNPLGGCLPTIIQIIMFPALYTVFLTFVGENAEETIAKFNEVVYTDALKLTSLSDPTFFGLPLAVSPASLFQTAPLILLIPLVTAGLQLLQAKMMFATKKDQPKPTKKKTSSEPDFQTMMQKQMVFLIPVTIGIASFSFPIGLALYWNTFTIFGMIQQYRLQGWGGLTEWIEKIAPSRSSASK